MIQTGLNSINTTMDNMADFQELFIKHKKHVFAMALSILRDFELAEDVLQEVYIKLYQQLKRNEITNIKAWLIRVARNTALDLYRKKKHEITGFDNQYFERVHIHTDNHVEKMVLTKYLENLDSEERQIVILKDISGMKHKEIADIVEMPLGTVLWKYGRALKKLKKILSKEESH